MDPSFFRVLESKVRATFGARASIISFSQLAGDASSRRYYRASLDGEQVPSSVVVMELSGKNLPLSSEELAIFPEPLAELPFLNLHRFLRRLGVRVPRLYGQWAEEGLLMLEDVGDVSLWDAVQQLPFDEIAAWYEKAIDQLLRIQIEGTRARDENCIAFRQRFDFRLYMWEFEHFLEYGFDPQRLSPGQKRLLGRAFREIATRLDGQSPYLNHRDYHSWNLMVYRGEIVVIDFQDALLAPLQYDLASLLNDRETDRLVSNDLERRLLDYYLEQHGDLEGRRLDRDEFIEIYLLSAIQRDLKVVGRFYYLDRVKGKPGYKRYIPPTLRRLKRTLQRCPGQEQILEVLAEHFAEMR
ncbi:MAG TPA: phosphotransferase [Candidatus Acidoferrales bacterium]|nr:phosphotransferase [Candidatus Acidoferrales bacterium]